MNNDKDTGIFSYSYSAKQQEEIRRIREKYVAGQVDKMAQLRKLDESVTRKGTATALVIGVCASLVLGTGMSMCMVGGGFWMMPGVLIGLIGLAGVAAAYPLYVKITKREREKIAPEIIRLTDELLK